MSYRIVIADRALSDLRGIRDHIAQRNPDNAARFLEKLLDSFDVLEDSPESFGKAPEDELASYTLRQYVVKPYRILYRMEGKAVQILHVRHGARPRARPDELS
jgi:addiction module RelE/StbE family toxin